MAATYKARFNRIVRPEIIDRTIAEQALLSGVSKAIDMRKHKAAYSLNEGVGMLAVTKIKGDEVGSLATYDLAAAVVMRDGTIIAEHHHTSGIRDEVEVQPCGTYGSECSAVMLPPVGELTALDDFTLGSDDPHRLALHFDDTLDYVMDGNFDDAAAALPS